MEGNKTHEHVLFSSSLADRNDLSPVAQQSKSLHLIAFCMTG